MVFRIQASGSGDRVRDLLDSVPDEWYGSGLKEEFYKLARGCLRKRAFETRREAHRDAERLRKKRGVRLGVYRCSSCGKWHLTSARNL